MGNIFTDVMMQFFSLTVSSALLIGRKTDYIYKNDDRQESMIDTVLLLF